MDVTVIGAGLAGCEAAYRIAQSGYCVQLTECKPQTRSPAHKTDGFAELVCSNSLKSETYGTAGGLLKTELRILGSLLLQVADTVRVPAGGALAVDRALFSEKVTQAIRSHPKIRITEEVAEDVPDDTVTVIATGPLTIGRLNDALRRLVGAS